MMRQLAPDVHVMPIRRHLMLGQTAPTPVRGIILRVGDAGDSSQVVLSRDEAARLAADLIALLEEPADA